ncbi:hypothetical protein TNCV_404371 [Trichonephila clavipes]|nr:hypothetical protein TNCV_404371 [Trichonephila clavipes]
MHRFSRHLMSNAAITFFAEDRIGFQHCYNPIIVLQSVNKRVDPVRCDVFGIDSSGVIRPIVMDKRGVGTQPMAKDNISQNSRCNLLQNRTNKYRLISPTWWKIRGNKIFVSGHSFHAIGPKYYLNAALKSNLGGGGRSLDKTGGMKNQYRIQESRIVLRIGKKCIEIPDAFVVFLEEGRLCNSKWVSWPSGHGHQLVTDVCGVVDSTPSATKTHRVEQGPVMAATGPLCVTPSDGGGLVKLEELIGFYPELD